MKFSLFVITTLLFFTSICPGRAFAQIQDEVDSATLSYAKANGISTSEAQTRMEKLPRIRELGRRLRKDAPLAFAGIYVEEKPEHRAVVRLVGDAKQLLSTFTEDPFFVAENAPRSLQFLQEVQVEISDELARMDIDHVSDIEIETSTIRLEVDPIAIPTEFFRQLLSPYDFIRVEKFSGYPEPLSLKGGVSYYGTNPGGTPSAATLGFNVVNSMGDLGTVSVAHGPKTNITHVDDVPMVLIYQGHRWGGGYDVQWFKQDEAVGFVPQSNTIQDGFMGEIEVTGTLPHAELEVDTPVCKTGRSSLQTCGTIKSTNFLARVKGAPDRLWGYFVRVAPHVVGTMMAQGGDSGGPVYEGNNALGLVIAAYDDLQSVYFGEMLFMPIDRLSALDLTVITDKFAIDSIPDVTGEQNVPIPVEVLFKGHPRFPVERTTVNVSCPSGWYCAPYSSTYADFQESPLRFSFQCNTGEGKPTARFLWRTTLVGGDGIASNAVDHWSECREPEAGSTIARPAVVTPYVTIGG